MVRKGTFKPAVLVLCLVLVLTGCATKVRLSQFEEFGAAGRAYTTAVDVLLDKAGETRVNTDSDKLLDTKITLVAVSEDKFDERDDALLALLEEMRLIQRHNGLLADYFSALEDLATSNAPEAFAAEARGTVTALDTLSGKLGQSSLLKNEDAAKDFAAKAGELIVRGIQVKHLEDELQSRKETIAEILVLHERLLGALQRQFEGDIKFTQRREYEKKVLIPYRDTNALKSDSDQQRWKKARLEYLRGPDVVKELADAAAAANALRAAWFKLLSHELTPVEVQEVIGNLDSILAGVGELKKAESTE